MDRDSVAPAFKLEVEPTGSGDVRVRICGRADREAAAALLADMTSIIKNHNPHELWLDLSQASLDDFGVFVLFEIRKRMRAMDGSMVVSSASNSVHGLLDRMHFDTSADSRPLRERKREPWMTRLGEASLKVLHTTNHTVSFVGSVVLCFLEVARRPGALRRGDTLVQMEKTGADALPIVGLISFLLGLIMAFMSSVQLEQFGANIYVASLVSLAMASELGPIMTAIVVAGRSGSAYAAEIGAMRISEEIDALYTMGFNPTLFLAVPRVIACAVVVPLLTIFSVMFAISGGLVLGVLMLDLTPASYMAQTIKSLTLFEVFWGISKSIVFAVLIAVVGCLRGFQVRGGASAVGNAATSAVVSSIFLIILFDSIFAIVRTYWT